MCQPDNAHMRIPTSRKPIEKPTSDADVTLWQWIKVPHLRGRSEFRRDQVHTVGDNMLLVSVIPLHNIVVLHTYNRQAVKIMGPHQRLYIRDMSGRNLRSDSITTRPVGT